MTTKMKKMTSLAVSGLLLAGGAVPAAQAAADTVQVSGAVQEAEATAAAVSTLRTEATVQGDFSWNQGVLTRTADLARNIYDTAQYRCEGAAEIELGEGAAAPIERIRVTGDVGNAFVASVAELEQAAPVKKVMGCSCSGNPVDGRASGNAEVGGFALRALIELAEPDADANTVTFTARDGYQVSLPLFYVLQHYSIVATQVNGQDMADGLGCANQLWVGGIGARSFVRDIVAVQVTAEDEAPALPTEGATPNVSILSGASS